MPTKKATRPTRSTRATKVSSKLASSDLVLDENVDVQSEVADTKKKSSKSTAASKKVLGERNAPNDHVSSPPKESSKTHPSSQKLTKSKKGKKAAAAAAEGDVKDDPHSLDSRATTPVPSSPSKKRLPEEQVQAFLQNYDLETETRISRLRASLEITIQSSVTRMRLAIERIPRAVRELSLADFVDEYGADIHTFMNNAPVQHLKETQKEWDQIREERSPAKAKRAKNDEEAVSKVERTSKTARSFTSTTTKKKATRSTRATSAIPASPVSTSSKPAPSLSTFQPALPKEALQTPKPRMARPGEVIQWQSINGSPICGIIGEDGRVMPVSFA